MDYNCTMRHKIIFYEQVKKFCKDQKPQKKIKTVVDEAGFLYNTYNKDRSKGRLPRADVAVKIARILGVHVEELVTGNKPDLSEQSKQEKRYMSEYLDNLLNNLTETINKHKEIFLIE